MSKNFGVWLQKELKNRDMSQADLSRMSGVTSAQISRIISGSRGAGKNALKAIASGLNIPQEIVFRKAGFLSPETNTNPLIKQIMHLIAQLPEDEIEDLTFIAEAKLKKTARKEQKKQYRKTANSAP